MTDGPQSLGQQFQIAGVQVKHALGLRIARQVCAEWNQKHPDEVRLWRKRMKVRFDECQKMGPWSPSRELLVAADFPHYVLFRIKRLLIKAGWDPDEARFWHRGEGNEGGSDLFKAVIRELLPEAKSYRKEQLKVFHRGVSLPSMAP